MEPQEVSANSGLKWDGDRVWMAGIEHGEGKVGTICTIHNDLDVEREKSWGKGGKQEVDTAA